MERFWRAMILELSKPICYTLSQYKPNNIISFIKLNKTHNRRVSDDIFNQQLVSARE